MAAVQPFTLFPGAVPKISLPNPHTRQRSLHRIGPYVDATSKSVSVDGGAVVIQVEEEPPVPKVVEQKHHHQQQQQVRSRTPSPGDIGRAVTTISPIEGSTPSPSLAPNGGQLSTSPQPASTMSPKSPASGSATLVQAVSADSPVKSPVVPIRSMFPTYNPSVPLAQQSYHPQRPFPARMSSLHRSAITREEYRGSVITPIDRFVGTRTAPASVANFSTDGMSISEPQYSSHRELEKLWAVSHGSEPSEAVRSFDLEMTRTSEATFIFGCDPGFPFYTLNTFDTSEFAVMKTCPRKRTLNQDIVMSSLEPPYRRTPPYDGLVTFIFPKLAAKLAINQSASLAKEHQLAPTDRDDVEAAAVRRAAQQEACNLRWNDQFHRYELEHPAIGRSRREPEFIQSATSPRPHEDLKPVLHITVSSSSNCIGSPIAIGASAPVILVTDPSATFSPNASAAGGIRLSTLPQSDLDAPLACLDFGSSTLHINANQILDLMPSLFAIDSIVSAIMAVAVADERTNPVMGSMPIWNPRPRGPASVFGGSVRSYNGSAFYATIAEREEAEEQAKVMRRDHEKDVKKTKKQDGEDPQRTWYGKTKKSKPTKKQIIIGEFDLEKLGHYQSGDRRGQELPGVTRSALAGLVVGLKFLVWFLTVIAQFMAWALVNVSRALTSEKF